MKTLLLALVTGLTLTVAAFTPASTSTPDPAFALLQAPAATYTIDPAHTNVGFRIRHMGVAFVEGEFDAFEGSITFDPSDVGATRANVTVQTASIDTDITQRDDHLRSGDFFEVETHPTMTFVSTGVRPTGPTTFRLVGDLAIKRTTREVAFDVTAAGPIPIENGQRVGFHATAEIDRRDFGITWGSDLPGGVPAVGHRVQIILDVEGVARP